MTEGVRDWITSEDYADLIIDYRYNPQLLEIIPDASVHIMNEIYAILHFPVTQFNRQIIELYGYASIPKVLGLTSEVSIEASGVDRLRNIPNFNLRGEGVLVGIVDTGIDYTKQVFRNINGTTKITSIWDQTIDSEEGYPFDTSFGTEYSAVQINQALLSENPLEIVPSRDENGHGTMMAAVAAGAEDTEENFSGVAPEAELVIVKLKPAKQYLKNFFVIPEGSIGYQENTVMWGVQYCVEIARLINRPIVICIGLGSAQSSHDGRSNLSNFISILGDFPNVGIVVAAGNEGNMARHYYGAIEQTIGYNTVELNVGEDEAGFSMEIWGDSPGIYSIDLLSPSGEYIPRIAASLQVNREISFIFEATIIYIDYQMVETLTGDQLILLRLRNATPGIWRLNVYGQGDLPLGFHIWLPMGDFITTNIYFIQPNNFTTVLLPGNAIIPITITAYNPVNENLFVNASRGFNRNNNVKPELAAPGVNYFAPSLTREYVAYTGTGVAAAHAAGVVALMLEWGEVRGNQPGLDSNEIKNYLIRGARRSANLTYPNRDWGYGILDIFNVFDVLRVN